MIGWFGVLVAVAVFLVGCSSALFLDVIHGIKVKITDQFATFDEAHAICQAIGMQLFIAPNMKRERKLCWALPLMPFWVDDRNFNGTDKVVDYSSKKRDSFCPQWSACRRGVFRRRECNDTAPFICQEIETGWMKSTMTTTERTTTEEETTLTTTAIYLEDDAEDTSAWINWVLWFSAVGMMGTVVVVYGSRMCRNRRQSPMIVNRVETAVVNNMYYENNYDHYEVVH